MPRILIIEDDAVVRRVMEDTLKTEHEVFTAENGKQGLAMHRAQPMDLIVTDIYMPEMEGLELLNVLRRSRSKTPVIAVSTNWNCDALEMAKKLGAVKILGKPFQPGQLRAAVSGVLDQKA